MFSLFNLSTLGVWQTVNCNCLTLMANCAKQTVKLLNISGKKCSAYNEIARH